MTFQARVATFESLANKISRPRGKIDRFKEANRSVSPVKIRETFLIIFLPVKSKIKFHLVRRTFDISSSYRFLSSI